MSDIEQAVRLVVAYLLKLGPKDMMAAYEALGGLCPGTTDDDREEIIKTVVEILTNKPIIVLTCKEVCDLVSRLPNTPKPAADLDDATLGLQVVDGARSYRPDVSKEILAQLDEVMQKDQADAAH